MIAILSLAADSYSFAAPIGAPAISLRDQPAVAAAHVFVARKPGLRMFAGALLCWCAAGALRCSSVTDCVRLAGWVVGWLVKMVKWLGEGLTWLSLLSMVNMIG